jgi:hypothetical protein
MTEWMPLEKLERLLSMVDVFESLPPHDMRTLASGAVLRLGHAPTWRGFRTRFAGK